MSYNCGGSGYCSNSGIEQIVQYARPMFDQPQGEGQQIEQYQKHAITHSATATPAYIDNIDSIVKGSYIINMDRQPQVISVGGSSNYQKQDYDNNTVSENYNNTKPTKEDFSTSVTPFINPGVPTKFIGEVDEIKQHIEETFEMITESKLPDNFTIEVCDVEKLQKMHEQFGGTWSPGIQGFAINKRHLNQPSHIFIKKGPLANVMVVIGHELGHIQSTTLINKHDEEAKAYAFEMAWIKAIHQHNIADLRAAIRVDGRPAENGLHNVSFNFVQKLLAEGKEALKVFKSLISGDLQVKHDQLVSLI